MVAESLLVKHQLLILNRSRHRAPGLRLWDRLVADWCTLFMRPSRLIRSAIVLKPSTLLHLHQILTQRKYHLLFSAKGRHKPGPNGRSKELIDAIAATKQHNFCWGCLRIAQQIALAFGVPVDKDVVRRVLATRYLPKTDAGEPSWLTFLGHIKDSLWSADIFRCESGVLRTHWVLVVMDHYTPRIMGSARRPARSTASLFVECSTTPFVATAPCRNTSVPTTIRFIVSSPVCRPGRTRSLHDQDRQTSSR